MLSGIPLALPRKETMSLPVRRHFVTDYMVAPILNFQAIMEKQACKRPSRKGLSAFYAFFYNLAL